MTTKFTFFAARSRTCLLVVASAVLMVFGAVEVRAGGTDYTWDGGGGNGNWNIAANWNAAIGTAIADANLIFSGSVQTTTTNNYAAGTNIFRSFVFATNAAAFNLTGNSVTLTAVQGFKNNGTVAQTVNLNGIVIGVAALSFDATAGDLIINSPMSSSGAFGFDVTGIATTKVVMTGSNSHTGTNTVTSGTLRIANGNALGTTAAGTTVASGAALELTTNSSGAAISVGAEALTISGTGISSGGALRNITGNNTYGGLITLGAASRINSDSGTLSLTNTGTITGPTFGLTLGGAGNIVLDSVIGTTTGTLTKDGAGTATLTASNTFTGTTTLTAGTLVLGNSGALSGSAVNVGTGAAGTLSFGSLTAATFGGLSGGNNLALTNSSGQAVTLTLGGGNTSASYSGILSGSTTLTKIGTGTQTLTGANTYSGGTLISAGALAGDTTSLQSGITNNSVLIFAQSTNGTYAFALQGTGALVKTNAGTLILSGANTYSGTTTITNGVLNIQNSAALGTTAAGTTVGSGAALELQGGISVGAEALTLNGTGIGGAGALRNISGDNTYGGLITLGSASEISSDSGTLSITNTGTITGATFGLTLGGAGNLSLASIIGTTTGTLTKDGAGTVTLTAANTYTGATTISVGALNIRTATGLGTTAAGTTVTSGAALELQGGITVGAETLSLSDTGINGGGALRNISGDNTYGGVITLAAASRINSDAGTLTINSAGSITGNFGLSFGGAGNIVLNDPFAPATATSGNLTKDGAGTLTLGAVNTYTGLTTVSDGRLTFGIASALSSGAVTVNGTSAVLDIAGFSDTVGAVTLVDGTITGTTGVLTATSYTVTNGAVSANLAGAVTMAKGGSGTVTLSGSNSFTGATTIGAGVLRAASSNALGTVAGGVTVSNNAALELSGGINIGAEALSIAGTGISSGGALRNVSGNNTYGGLLTLTNATRINSDAGTLSLTNTGTITGATFGLTLGGAGDVVLNSVIGTTTGTLAKDGAGTVRLGAINTYGGVTTVGGGVLQVTNVANAGVNSSIGTNGTIILTNGGVLDYAGTTNSSMNRGINLASGNGGIGVSNTAATLTASGVISNTGTFVKTGTGTLILTVSNTYSGGTLLNAGTLAAGNAFAFGSGSITLNAGLLNLSNFSIANTLINNGGTLTNVGTTTGAQLNGGTTTLSASNNTVAEVSGTATVAVSGANTTITNMTGGTVNAATNIVVQNYNGGNITNSTSVTIQSGDSAGSINGAGSLVKTTAGTLTLSAANTYGGTTTVGGGVLSASILANAGSASSIGTNGTVILTNGGTLDYTGASVSVDRTVNLASGSGGIGVSNSAAALTISGAISNTGTLVKSGAGTLILSGANTYSGGTLVSGGTLAGNTTSLQGNITNNAAVEFSQSAAGTYSNVLSGSGALTKTGAATLTLNGANSYAGGTTISAGVLNVRNGSALGATNGGTTVASGAALELQGGISIGAEGLVLSGSGLGGAGALRNVIGFNTYGGNITNQSAARINSDVNTLTLSGGIDGNNQLLTFGGVGDVAVSGAISNSTAGVTKDGAGVLTLSGLNTYTGTTTVSAGTLAFGGNNVIGSGAVTVNGGTLSVGAFSDTVGAVTLTSGSIIGSGGVLSGSSYAVESGSISANLGGSGAALTKNGAGTVALSGTNSYTGATAINGGTLALGTTAAVAGSSGINLGNSTELQYTGAAATLDRNISVTNGTGTIRNTGSGALTISGNVAKDGTVLRFNGGTFNITGVVSGASANSDLVVDSATVTLSNANSYNGPTFIRNAGVLNANVVGALPTNIRTALTLDDTGSGGSKLSLGANQVIASLTGADSSLVTLGANTLTIGATSGSTTFAGAISGTGGLVKDGGSTQILTGSNTFSGPLTISAGTVQIGNGTDAGSIGSVSSISNNGVLAYQIGSGTRTLTAPISGTGSLSLNSPGGILNVNGTNSYSGGTTITAGELHAGTSSSVGTGSVTLAGTNASFLAQFHYSNTTTPLGMGALSLNGNAALDLQPNSSMASTGVVSIAGTNNAIFIAGNTWNTGTNTLVSGTSLSFGGGASIYLGGTAVNNTQVALGSTLTNGRTSYNFNTNSTSFYVLVNGVAFDLVWSGAANSQWNTNTANWQQSAMGTNPSGTNIAFVNADDVYFGNAATSNAITVASGITAADMFVTNSTGTVALNGAQFSGFSLTKSGAGNLTVSNAFVLLGDDVGLTNGTLLNSGSGNVTLAGNFTQGNLVQAGAGTTTLAASNSFAGGTTISNGTVLATANNALGSGDLTVSGGTADVGSTAQNVGLITLNSGSIAGSGSLTTASTVQAKGGTISAALAGSGGVTKSGTGTVTLSGANSYTGLTHVTGGMLSVSANNNLGSATNALHMQGGTLRTTGSFASGRAVTMTTSGNFETASGTGLQLTGDITGGGVLTKSGAGTLTLSGNNASFSGNTALDAGTLRLGSANAAGTGALTQGAGTKLEIDTTGTIANTMTLRDVSFLQSATLSGGLTLNTATFAVNTDLTGTLTGVVGGTGGLAKTGAGTLVLDNANTYAGGTLIAEGGLKVLKAGALSSGNITNNGVLEIAVPTSVATNGVNISNTISGTGSLVRTGVTGQGISLTGTADNTYTGLTIVNSGTLRFDKSSGAQAVGGNVEVNGGALIISGNEQIPDDKTLTITGGTFDFSPNATPGRTETLATLTKSGGTLRTYGNNLNVTNLSLSGGGTNWINANANGTAGSITVRSGGTGLVLSGNDSPTITIGTGATGTTNRLILQNGVTANVTNGTAQIVSASISGSATDVAGVVDLDGGTRTFNVSNGSAATDMLVSASIGNGGLIKSGEGRLALSGSNSYAGGTTLSAGQLRLGSATAAGTGTITQTDGTTTLEIDTTGTLANAMSIYNISTLQTVTLSGAKTLNNATFDVATNTTYTETGVLSGGGGVDKIGAGTMVLAGSANNTYTGATVVEAGALMLSNSAGNAINDSSSITVNSGASLILGASNQIGDGIGLTLNGGTFIVGTATTGYSETLGTLTLSASSTIDLGSYSTGLRQLTFANSSAITWTGTLTITNWQGMTRSSSDVAEILFGTGGLTSTQLGQIYFANQDITGGVLVGGNGELVPIPEAKVYWGVLALVLAVGYRERRRLVAILRQVRQGKIG